MEEDRDFCFLLYDFLIFALAIGKIHHTCNFVIRFCMREGMGKRGNCVQAKNIRV